MPKNDTCGSCGEAKPGVKWFSIPQAGGVTYNVQLCPSCARKTQKSLPPQVEQKTKR